MGSAKNGAQNLLLVRCSEERAPQKLPPPAEREISKGVSKEEVGAAMRRGVIGIQKYN